MNEIQNTNIVRIELSDSGKLREVYEEYEPVSFYGEEAGYIKKTYYRTPKVAPAETNK